MSCIPTAEEAHDGERVRIGSGALRSLGKAVTFGR